MAKRHRNNEGEEYFCGDHCLGPLGEYLGDKPCSGVRETAFGRIYSDRYIRELAAKIKRVHESKE